MDKNRLRIGTADNVCKNIGLLERGLNRLIQMFGSFVLSINMENFKFDWYKDKSVKILSFLKYKLQGFKDFKHFPETFCGGGPGRIFMIPENLMQLQQVHIEAAANRRHRKNPHCYKF